jgi:hypothetical protein
VERDSGSRAKSEVYAARQLGSIPRQIEGTQFGAIQEANIPPEFFVGVDERFDAMAGSGLVDSMEHGQRVAADPAVLKLMLGHRPAVMHHLENSDSPPRRLQREEDSGLRLPVPDSRDLNPCKRLACRSGFAIAGIAVNGGTLPTALSPQPPD